MGFIHVGQFRSEMQNPQMKVNRIIQAAEELRGLLKEVEAADLLKQESFSRENKSLITRINAINKTLDQEIIYNNALTKEIRALEERLKMMHEQEFALKDEIEKLQNENVKLKKYKYKTRHRFKKWLSMKFKKGGLFGVKKIVNKNKSSRNSKG